VKLNFTLSIDENLQGTEGHYLQRNKSVHVVMLHLNKAVSDRKDYQDGSMSYLY